MTLRRPPPAQPQCGEHSRRTVVTSPSDFQSRSSRESAYPSPGASKELTGAGADRAQPHDPVFDAGRRLLPSPLPAEVERIDVHHADPPVSAGPAEAGSSSRRCEIHPQPGQPQPSGRLTARQRQRQRGAGHRSAGRQTVDAGVAGPARRGQIATEGDDRQAGADHRLDVFHRRSALRCSDDQRAGPVRPDAIDQTVGLIDSDQPEPPRQIGERREPSTKLVGVDVGRFVRAETQTYCARRALCGRPTGTRAYADRRYGGIADHPFAPRSRGCCLRMRSIRTRSRR